MQAGYSNMLWGCCHKLALYKCAGWALICSTSFLQPITHIQAQCTHDDHCVAP